MPFKVVHIITRMILGGAQENTLLTCEGLRRSPEWDVTLVTGPAIGPEGELIQRAVNSGIPLIIVPHLRRAIHPLRDALSFAKLLKIIRSIRPHIVHTHSSKAGVLGRLAARVQGAPVILHTIHGLPFHPYEKSWRNWAYIRAERIAARCSDRLVCVADAMARQALAAGVGRPEQYVTVYSGMEVDSFLNSAINREKVRKQFGFSDRDVVIGAVARLFPLKGYEYIVEAAPSIVRRCPQARFLFVGDGILRRELQRQAGQLGLAQHIAFAGLVDSSRIPSMISAMDIVVHASLREGLARVLVQSLLCGKPAVAYDVDGNSEVIIDGVTGRLIAPRTVKELAQAVIGLIEDPGKATEMGSAGRQRFTEQFRAETMVRQLENLYRRLLDEKGVAS